MSDQKILESIMNYESDRDLVQDIGSSANHAINSVLNLIDEIHLKFDKDDAEDLTRRIFLAIKNNDYKKFERGLNNIAAKKGIQQ